MTFEDKTAKDLTERLRRIAMSYRSHPYGLIELKAVVYGQDADTGLTALAGSTYMLLKDLYDLKVHTVDLAGLRGMDKGDFFMSEFLEELGSNEGPNLVVLNNFDRFVRAYLRRRLSAPGDFRAAAQNVSYGIIGVISTSAEDPKTDALAAFRDDPEFWRIDGVMYHI